MIKFYQLNKTNFTNNNQRRKVKAIIYLRLIRNKKFGILN